MNHHSLEKLVQFIEVSHPIKAGMKTYPGLREPKLKLFFTSVFAFLLRGDNETVYLYEI